MSLTVCVYLNGRQIADAVITNVSGLSDLSDYEFAAAESASEVTGLSRGLVQGRVRKHRRKQSVWALVEKVARQSALRRARSAGVEVREVEG